MATLFVGEPASSLAQVPDEAASSLPQARAEPASLLALVFGVVVRTL